MKIIHLNTFDIRGGAARAAYRIHTSLQQIGISSEMLVAQKECQDITVKGYHVFLKKRKIWLLHKLLRHCKQTNQTHYSCNIFPSGIHRVINRSESDIVHFHWIGDEMICISEIKKIKKPIVWTLHDMWAFCGAEHCDDINNPFRYKNGYKKNDNEKWYNFDINAWTFKRKEKYWKNIIFSFIAPSKWIAGCCCESKLFNDKEINVIPNCLDVSVFKPTDMEISKKKYKLSVDKKIILFGADGGAVNPLKGYHLLTEALNYFSIKYPKKNIELVVFGGAERYKRYFLGAVPIVEIGKINEDEKLAMLYSAADVFVIPSMMDNLPNTVMEAMSCGTPCVGFDIGGIPDMIDHKKNGFIAYPFDTACLAEGIRWILNQGIDSCREMRKSARKKVLKTYHPMVVARKYEILYQRVLSQWRENINNT